MNDLNLVKPIESRKREFTHPPDPLPSREGEQF